MSGAGSMLGAANWTARLGASVLIAFLVFAIKPASGGNLAAESIAFVVSMAVLAFAFVSERRPIPQFAVHVALGVMAAVVGVTFLAPNGAALIGFAVMAVLIAGADTAPIAGWVIGGTALLAVEVGAIVHDATTASVVGYPLILIACFIGGRNRRSYRVQAEQSAALLAQADELRAEQGRVAVLDERSRIAREIHDVLAHSLGALGIQIQAVRAVLADGGDTERALGLLDQAQRLASDGLVETRRAVQALRGDATRLDEQLSSLVQAHRDRHSTEVDLVVSGQPAPLPAESTVALIRTAQEALVNAAKHAPAQRVAVRLSYDDDHVLLRVDNPLPAPGAETAANSAVPDGVNGGYGLIGMRERLLLIDGTLDTGVHGGAWTVTAAVPRNAVPRNEVAR